MMLAGENGGSRPEMMTAAQPRGALYAEEERLSMRTRTVETRAVASPICGNQRGVRLGSVLQG